MNTESIKNLLKKEWHIPYEDKINKIIHSFSLSEKTIFYFFSAIFIVSGFSLLWRVNSLFLVDVPEYGGSITEGVIGSPRFLNPLLAISDTDRDISSLIYSGLLKAMPDGNLVPDLAESYTISPNGLTYTFILKNNLEFHDGAKVTADDVIFTINKAQDTNVKSPRKKNWDGVTVEKVDNTTIVFTLKQPYAPFIYNTTLGILPKHIWKNATADEFPFSQYNTKPVGSGPYEVDSITYTDSGLPSEYHLTAYSEYALGEPYITSVNIKSFQNEKDLMSAYKGGDIESVHSISPHILTELQSEDNKIVSAPLPRVFGVFFNQNNAPIFVHKEVRQALNSATDRKEIIDTVLAGFGHSINEAIPQEVAQAGSVETFDESSVRKAQELLSRNGWTLNESGILEKKNGKETTTLTFSISTSDAPELKAVAEILQRQWQKIGARVEVKIFDVSDLNQNIIRPRKYDSLLFGEIIGKDMDIYPFWHSSQRTDPGLNIALYANLKADKILDSLRTTTDPHNRTNLYEDFNKEINADIPAVFIYSPSFLYLVPDTIKNIHIGQLTVSSERFSNVHRWYIKTNKVWEIFNQ